MPVPPIRGGAVEKLWYQLGMEFSLAGQEVVHISRRDVDLPLSEFINGVFHRRIQGYDAARSVFLAKLFDLVYSIRVLFVLPPSDIIITNVFWLPVFQPLLRPQAGLSVVSVERMPKGQLFLYRHVSLLRLCSTAVYKRAITQTPQLSSKYVTVPNPIPFCISDSSIYTNKKNTILYTGRIHPEKGLDLLIRAYNIASHLGLSDWTLRIVGPSDTSHGGAGHSYLSSLQRIASSCLAKIEWVEPIYDQTLLHAEYQSASIFVYPSIAETGEAFGVSPLEAMAFGAVPIVSSLECFKDFIFHGQNGLTFDHRSPLSDHLLSSLLLSLTTDPHLLNTLSQNALNVRRTHDPSTIARQMLGIFHKLLSSDHPETCPLP